MHRNPNPRRRASGLALLAATALMTSAACASDEPDRDANAGERPSPVASDQATGVARPTPSQTQMVTLPPTPPPRPTLPAGGRVIFPTYRLVGFSGGPGTSAFGRLGVGSLEDRARELRRQAKPYTVDRKVLPVFELIATVAHPKPGRDGKFRGRVDEAVVRHYLRGAREAKALLLLNIQPGRADFLPEVKAYEKWLRQPDVGLALDPEWAVQPGQVPGRSYGRTTGRELDSVAAYVAGLVKRYDLPEKVLVFHQVASSVVRQESGLRAHPGVVLIKSVDGIGSYGAKLETWTVLTKSLARHVHPGFKLFYQEDAERGGLMTPKQVLGLKPTPEYVLYE